MGFVPSAARHRMEFLGRPRRMGTETLTSLCAEEAPGRREVIGWGLGVLASTASASLSFGGPAPAAAAGGILAQPEVGRAAYGSPQKIEEYMGAIKNTRRLVADSETEVRAKKKIIDRLIGRSVEPLIDAMLLNELPLELSDEQLLAAAQCPQEMKGHLAELRAFANDPAGFDVYMDSYKGGHVERELEEMVETTSAYLDIVKAALDP